MRTIVVLVLLISACRKPDPAPTDLDGLIHFFWDQWETGDDDTLAEGVRNLDAEVDGAGLEDTLKGTITDLSTDEVPEGKIPAAAQGLYIVRPFDCALGTLETILYDLHQDENYGGVYDSYVRVYTSDFEAYVAREVSVLTWDLDYTATVPLGDAYDAHAHGGMRYVADLGDSTPWGPFLVNRTFMPEPAVFPEGSNNSLEQDYQIEVYYQRAAGRIVHAYGMWRQGTFTFGLSMDDEGVQNTVLNNMADWDDETETLCASWR